MDTEFRTHGRSRRQLFTTGAFAGLTAFIKSSSATAQALDADEVMPARWNLVQNGATIARFSALDALGQEMQVPGSDDIAVSNAASPLPGRRKPAFVLLRNSPNVRLLRKWLEGYRP